VWTAQTLAEDLRMRYPYKVESWQENNAQLVSALNAESVSTGIIRSVVMVVVVLGSVLGLLLAVALNVALVASVCGVLAAIAPARRAAAMDPAQAIRL
jgi:lipoprotein-releasing system permease protein